MISRFPVIPILCFQRPQGLLVPDLCLSIKRTPFISPLQPRPVLRGKHSISQLLIWEVFHISKRHNWLNNKSSNVRWGWWWDKHCRWAQTELLYTTEMLLRELVCPSLTRAATPLIRLLLKQKSLIWELSFQRTKREVMKTGKSFKLTNAKAKKAVLF